MVVIIQSDNTKQQMNVKLTKVVEYSLIILLLTWNKSVQHSPESCFCQLKGQIDDCSCDIDNVDHFNNARVYPILQSLLVKDYFRYFKVNLDRECPFWADDSKCSLRDCSVQTCDDDKVPEGLKSNHFEGSRKYSKFTHKKQNDCKDDSLGALNSTISEETWEEFEKWKLYDDSKSMFCEMDDEFSNGMKYVDLLLNPERYTGYKGPSAHRVWNSIYKENCFQPDMSYIPFPSSQFLEDPVSENVFIPHAMCLEKRTFYRSISGLHTSINIHLCANYLLPSLNQFSPPSWGLNMGEFNSRFDPKFSKGEGPHRLKNLYFLYLLELRALAKVAPYLSQFEYYTGSESDSDVKIAVAELLKIVKLFPNHFDESVMFSEKTNEANKLKEEFRLHFRNISKIMDCVGCDKCRLWGKLQTQGLGTALKILFSDDGNNFSRKTNNNFYLKRTEVVSLFNAFGRLSTSIYELENIRKLHS